MEGQQSYYDYTDKVKDREKYKNHLQKLCEFNAEKVSAEKYNLEKDISQEVNLEGKVLEQEFACGRRTTHEGFMEQENGKDKNATYGEYMMTLHPSLNLTAAKRWKQSIPLHLCAPFSYT